MFADGFPDRRARLPKLTHLLSHTPVSFAPRLPNSESATPGSLGSALSARRLPCHRALISQTRPRAAPAIARSGYFPTRAGADEGYARVQGASRVAKDHGFFSSDRAAGRRGQGLSHHLTGQRCASEIFEPRTLFGAHFRNGNRGSRSAVSIVLRCASRIAATPGLPQANIPRRLPHDDHAERGYQVSSGFHCRQRKSHWAAFPLRPDAA